MSKPINNTHKIILGTVQFGLAYGINNQKGKLSKNEVFEILEEAASSGIDILDTADGYGNASKLIGEFSSNSGHKFLVNTKFKFASDVTIEKQLQYSLELLQAEQINVYFYHDFNDFIQHPEIKDVLLRLKEKGKIKSIGVSIYSNDQFKEAIQSNEVDVIQLPFNLLDNYQQRGKLIKQAKKAGKEIQVRSVFLQGLFFKDIVFYPNTLDALKPYMLLLHQVAKDAGKEIEDIALSYALAQDEIDHILIGVDSLEQIKSNLNFLSSQLDRVYLDRINNINVIETQLLYPYNWK